MDCETDPVALMVRWQGVGRPLSDIESEILLTSLYAENRMLRGRICVAAEQAIAIVVSKLQARRRERWPNLPEL